MKKSTRAAVIESAVLSGGGGQVTPEGAANLYFWYRSDAFYSDAGSTLATNGQGVYQMTDKGTGGLSIIQATADNRPTMTTNQINGYAVARFDGSNDWLRNLTPNPPNPLTVYFVAKPTAARFEVILGMAAAYYIAYNTNTILITAGSSVGADANAAPINSAYIVTVVFNGASSYIRINGGSQKTGDSGSNTGDRIHLGSTTAGSTPFTGDIPEMFAFNVAHGSGDFSTWESYLSSRYAINLA